MLIAWCEEHGCAGIDAVALPGNRATKNFFERYGLTARALLVHRRLGPDPERTWPDPERRSPHERTARGVRRRGGRSTTATC